MAVRNASTVGVDTVRAWAETLPRGAAILDLGCGHGMPISAALLEAGLTLYAVDASATLTEAFRVRFPGVPVQCRAVEHSDFFGRTFDGAVAWGLLFLLSPDVQEDLIVKVANTVTPGGSFLFTAPKQRVEWTDVMTGQRSVSLGAEVYRSLIAAAGLEVIGEREDEGSNYYYVTRKTQKGERTGA